MTILQQASQRLTKNKKLDLCLDELVSYSISNRILIFDQNALGLDFEMLLAENILKRNADQYEIIDYLIVGYKIFSRFEKEVELEENEEYMLHALIAKRIDGIYKSGKRVRGITSLLRDVWATAIIHANSIKGIEFLDYIKSLDIEKDKEEIFSFNEGYCRTLSDLKLKVEIFFENAIQLIKWIKSDAEYNMPLSSLLAGIKKMVDKDNEYGIKLFEYNSTPSDYEVTFLIPVISGLYENLGKSFFYSHLENKLSNEDFSVAVICGLSNIKSVSDNDCELFFKVFKNANKGNDNVILNLPRLLFSILKSKDTSINPEHIQTAFLFLNELLNNDNEKLIIIILRELWLLEGHVELIQNLTIDLIKKPHFKKEYLKQLDHVLWHLKDVHFIEKVIYTISQRLPFISVHEHLSTTINELRTGVKIYFDKVLVNLLIQDQASVRFIGQDIFRNLSQRSYTFDYDILELPPLSQYKLWVSVLQDYIEPKYSIPCLVPLLRSDSGLIRESFISKLEEITESYGNLVITAIKRALPQEEPISKTIIERVQNYLNDFKEKNVDIKSGIKELNPVFTHYSLFVDFDKKRSRIFNRQMQKIDEGKNSFLNLITKVTLLKGGGWKMDGKNEISKLGRFSSSFSLPRLYFIFPEKFDYDLSSNKRTDWKADDFAIIQKHLLYEQQ